jgi:hypothetical protein
MNRPRYCPWVPRPTHEKNGRIMVDKWTPVVFGYCPQDDQCGSCAGTGFKPNILLNVGRPSDTVACPFCDPQRYRKEVEKLGKWKPTPAKDASKGDADKSASAKPKGPAGGGH